MYLFGFKLGNEGFEVILDSLYISLQSLTLSQSSISKVRSDSLSRCQFLIYLNLSENDIENDQYEIILKALKAQIEALILEDCKITKVMPDLVIQCKRLRRLSFGGRFEYFNAELNNLIRIFDQLRVFLIPNADIVKRLSSKQMHVLTLYCWQRKNL